MLRRVIYVESIVFIVCEEGSAGNVPAVVSAVSCLIGRHEQGPGRLAAASYDAMMDAFPSSYQKLAHRVQLSDKLRHDLSITVALDYSCNGRQTACRRRQTLQCL